MTTRVYAQAGEAATASTMVSPANISRRFIMVSSHVLFTSVETALSPESDYARMVATGIVPTSGLSVGQAADLFVGRRTEAAQWKVEACAAGGRHLGKDG